MFQAAVAAQPAPAVDGDFASMNPRASVLAVGGALVAPAGGLVIGKFCFVNPADNSVHSAYTAGYQIGFLGRNQQGLITVYLADNTQIAPPGFMITLFDEGEFWARFAAAAPTPDVPVYASTTDGSVQVASAGGVATGFTVRTIAAAGELAIISSWGV